MESKSRIESASLIGHEVQVEFWERVNCGIDEESELPRTITGKLIEAHDTHVVIDTERTLYRIRQSKIDSIKPFKTKKMPIIKKDQPMPERPVVTIIYGQPGICKTSLSNTAKNPLLIDCDRGADRAVGRIDTIVANNWEEVTAEQQYFAEYNTIVLDTAKAVLDDYLWDYCVRTDRSLTTKFGNVNDMKVYGAIGTKFKAFVNQIRALGCDLIIIAHAKEEKDNGVTKIYPDVTGSSKDLLYRIADQIGYISMINGKRTISFNPQDTVVGKNTAGLADIEIPDCNDIAFKNFAEVLIADVKKAIQAKDAAQVELLNKMREIDESFLSVDCAAKANELIPTINTLPKAQQKAFKTALIEKLKGIAVINKETKQFEDVSDKGNDAREVPQVEG